MVSTSYGVRFLLRAYERSTVFHFPANSCSCSFTSWADVEVRSKLYVSGKRKPSRASFLGPKPGIARGLAVAARYAVRESLTLRRDSRVAIFATTCTRAAMARRVNPSGKTILNCRFSRMVVVGGGAAFEEPRSVNAAATAPA